MTFSRKNIEWLMKRCGLKVQEFHWLIQDSTYLQSGVGAKIAAKLLFWIQCFFATLIRPAFSKEMIVVAGKDGDSQSPHDLVHRHSRSPHLGRQLCLPPILHQQFEAQVSNGQGRLGRVAAGTFLA